ncbi:uncharacterized protein EDB91DRAFT_1033060, partial [Suillus paluster]|uniref:uncharacterized protein n=1 Tax=Suillus paluster TaxID=48578 RepID=UPI001B86626B
VQISREEKDKLMAHAVIEYQAELDKQPCEKKHGLQQVCIDIQKIHLKETGQVITLSHVTLSHLTKGGINLSKFNSSTKRWLTEGKEETVIDYIQQMAMRGFPLNHKRLKEHVDEICQAQLGAAFPKTGVGRNW